MILGVFLIGLQQVVIDVLHAHLGASPIESQRLEFLHHQRPGRILRQRLIDVYSDLFARRHLPRHQVRADQLAGDVERHASLPPNGNGYRVRRSPRRSTPCCPGAIGLTILWQED